MNVLLVLTTVMPTLFALILLGVLLAHVALATEEMD